MAPNFEYKDDVGSLIEFPTGSVEPATAPTSDVLKHPGFATAGNHTVTIKEASSGAVASVTVTVQASAESPNGTVITPIAGKIVLANGTTETITAGSSTTQAALNTLAAAINTTQVSEVPKGECFSGVCYAQDFLAGDIVITTAPGVLSTGSRGSLTDKNGNVWTLIAGTPFQTNPADWWWGGVELNGSFTVGNPSGSLGGYYIALRLLNNGDVYVEEAKQGGWWNLTQAQATNDWPWNPNPFGRPGIGGDPGPGPNNTGTTGELLFTPPGTPDVTTSNVVQAMYWNHITYQQNTVGDWYSGVTGSYALVAESASNTSITGATGILRDGSNNLITTQNGQVYFNGVLDTTTANVTLVLWYNGVLYQENSAGSWYSGTKGAWTGPLSGDPRVVTQPPPGGGFATSGNTKVLMPNGAAYMGMGMNIYDVDAVDGGAISSTNNYVNQVFPKANFLRFTCFTGPGGAPDDVASVTPIVNKWTNNGAGPNVIEFECHLSGPNSLITGSTLTAWEGWYAALAAAFKNNPYVWFASQNEPWVDVPVQVDGNGVSQVTNMVRGIYTAVRGAGNTAPFIVMSRAVADPSGVTYGFDSNTLTGMTNIVWDLHAYAASGGAGDTNVNDHISAIQAQIAALQAFPGGNIPIGILECGNNTSGPPAGVDAGGGALLAAVETLVNTGAVFACAFWEWYESGDAGDNDQMVTGGGTGVWSTASLTPTGQGNNFLAWTSTGVPSTLS